MAGSILSLNFLLNFLPQETIKEIELTFIDILTPNFWKFSSSKSSQIRRSIFTLLHSILRILPLYVEGNMKLIIDIILKLFQEKDTSSALVIFPLMTEFFQNFPQSVVIANDGILNQFKDQLCNYIKSGCIGRLNTTSLILDLLRSFPEKVFYYFYLRIYLFF